MPTPANETPYVVVRLLPIDGQPGREIRLEGREVGYKVSPADAPEYVKI